MGSKTLQAKLHSLGEQLKVLKAQADTAQKTKKAVNFSSLYSILKGKGAFTEKEIDEALYRIPSKDR
jgi:multidrug resistance efflux pump